MSGTQRPGRPAGGRPAWLLAVPALVVVAALIVVPYINILVMSFRVPSTSKPYLPGFTVGNYAKALADPDFFYLELMADTLRLAACITLLCLLIAYPVAFHLARTTSRWKGVLYALVLSPLLVGVVIRSFGWIILLANNGLVNQTLKSWGVAPLALMYNEFGVVLALVHVFLPFMILPLMGAIQGIDPRLEEAARSLGAPAWTTFRRVTLPLIKPGVINGALFAFIISFDNVSISLLLKGVGTTTLPMQVFDYLRWDFDPTTAAASTVSILMTLGAVLVVDRFVGLRAMRY